MKRLLLLALVLLLVIALAAAAMSAIRSLRLPVPKPLHIIRTPTTIIRSGPIILEAIHAQAKLETISMVFANDQDVSKVWGVAGACRESITYLGYYTVTAGVDLNEITADDIVVDNDGNPALAEVTITIPPAAILHVEPDTQRSRVIHQEPSIISQVCGTKLPDMVLEAQANIQEYSVNAALQKGILQTAQERAGFEIQKLLLTVGYPKVTVRFGGE